MAITGGCLCGAVRFSVEVDAPAGVRQCWCRVCQYLGAGSGTVNVVFPKEAVTVSGPLIDHVRTADSGSVMHRRFCSHCGTPVFSEAEPRPHLIIARAGTLDDPEIAKPEMIIWTTSAPSWACFDPALPLVEGQNPPPSPKS